MDDQTQKTSLTEQITEALRDAIVMADYAPLAKLKISELADRFDASSGIVREALSRLSAEGLVKALPQKGFVVAPVSRSDLEELTDVRVAIERQCLSSSIEKGGLSWEAELIAARHRLRGITDQVLKNPAPENVREWIQSHTGFHDALTNACGNRWWLQIRRQLFLQSERYRQLSGLSTEAGRDVVAEHEAIAKATLERNSKRACVLIEEHMRRTTALLLDAI